MNFKSADDKGSKFILWWWAGYLFYFPRSLGGRKGRDSLVSFFFPFIGVNYCTALIRARLGNCGNDDEKGSGRENGMILQLYFICCVVLSYLPFWSRRRCAV